MRFLPLALFACASLPETTTTEGWPCRSDAGIAVYMGLGGCSDVVESDCSLSVVGNALQIDAFLTVTTDRRNCVPTESELLLECGAVPDGLAADAAWSHGRRSGTLDALDACDPID